MESLGTEAKRMFFQKWDQTSDFWSQKSHFGPIFILKGEMLKPPNEENEGFCPTADPPLSHC